MPGTSSACQVSQSHQRWTRRDSAVQAYKRLRTCGTRSPWRTDFRAKSSVWGDSGKSKAQFSANLPVGSDAVARIRVSQASKVDMPRVRSGCRYLTSLIFEGSWDKTWMWGPALLSCCFLRKPLVAVGKAADAEKSALKICLRSQAQLYGQKTADLAHPGWFGACACSASAAHGILTRCQLVPRQ